jgi:hypothetical protein
MVFTADTRAWAENIFGGCDLGDPRRVDRLVDYAARQAVAPSASTSRACKGDPAAHEGAYRLLRNPNVRATDIDDGAFDAVAETAAAYETVLAIQDSTGVGFKNPTAQVMAAEGNPTGFFVHSTLLVDAASGEPIGVVDQERWVREPKKPGEKRARRSYEEKESFKWEAANERVRHRIADMTRVITVGDRESDIYDFLKHLHAQRQRHVLRACADREIEVGEGRLWETLEKCPVLGQRTVHIQQRGGQRGGNGQNERLPRKGRDAVVAIRSAGVQLKAPRGRGEEAPIALTAILVREEQPPAGETPLEWMLLTTEPASTLAEASIVVGYYEKRWLIEEFHKAWKSGCRVEERPLQSPDALERMMAITAHMAVRILQLRTISETSPEASCEAALEKDEWQCLWSTTQGGKPLPKRVPTIRWAYEAVGRLGGWQDTKHTGRIGWSTLWHGWELLQNQVVAWRAALAMRDGAR